MPSASLFLTRERSPMQTGSDRIRRNTKSFRRLRRTRTILSDACRSLSVVLSLMGPASSSVRRRVQQHNSGPRARCDDAPSRLPWWQPLGPREVGHASVFCSPSVVVIVLLGSASCSRDHRPPRRRLHRAAWLAGHHPIVGGWRVTVDSVRA